MKTAPIPENEELRLLELKRYAILDTPPESTFDEITKLAATICETKIALVSLIDTNRQWFKSRFGLDATETPRDVSFCGHAIMGEEPFIIENAEVDARFCDNPLFLHEPHVRFYAGIPLISPKGLRIGTLCVIDPEKKSLNQTQIIILKSLAKHVIDLLELRIKNEELNQISLQYRDVQSISKTGGWELDVNTSLTKWSDEVYEIYQIPKGTPTNKFNTLSFYDEEDQLKLKDFIETCILNGTAYAREFKFKDALGRQKWVRSEGRPVVNSQGEIYKVVGTFQDITVRKRSEENIKNLLMELNKFFDLNLNYLCIAGIDGKFKKVNKAWLNLGYSENELLSIPFIDLIHPEDLEKTLFELSKLSQGQPTIDFENRYRMKNGGYRYLRWTASPDPGTGLIYSAAVDITEQKKRQLIHSEISQLRAVYIKYSSNRKGFFNYLLERLLFLTESEYGFIGEILDDEKGRYLKTYAITDISWNEQIKAFFDKESVNGLVFRNLNTLFGEVIKTAKPLITNDAKNHPMSSGTPHGHPPLNQFLGIPIFSKNNFIAMVGLANRKEGYSEYLLNEITPILDLMGEMLHAITTEAELEHQKNLVMHNSRLAAIGQLAAGVGHEINNPLQILSGHLSLAKIQLKAIESVGPKILERFDKMEIALTRISNIVKGLRTFARSDDSQISSFNMCELVKETTDLVSDIYRKEEVTVFYDCPRRHELVDGNRGRIQQVLMNLMANAKDASEGKANRKIDISVAPDGEFIKLSVQDNGHGIPEEIRDRILEPFYTTKDVNKGTGLGLSLVNTIVKEHGGKLDFETIPGEGTKFIVRLPIKRTT